MTRKDTDTVMNDLGILNKCGAPASYIYQWPGIYGTFVCQEHLPEIVELAKKFDLEMQYQSLAEENDDKQCEIRQRDLG